MSLFQSCNDELLGNLIKDSASKVVFMAPGIGNCVANELIAAMERDELSVTIILDADEDAFRVGYGDVEALAKLHAAASRNQFPLRRQAGIRIGLLVADECVVVWAPTARCVEAERAEYEPNALVLTNKAIADDICHAVGADQSTVLPQDAQIGREALRMEDLALTLERLASNPPEPFNLAHKARVFSTKFQFIEFEVRGAEWTERRIRLSSLLLNADLPTELQDVLDSQVRPFQSVADLKFDVPLVVNGEPAYKKDGSPMTVQATQADIAKGWANIRDRYLRQLRGFGWLIRRDQMQAFNAEVLIYEGTLKVWVAAFKNHALVNEEKLVAEIDKALSDRVKRASKPEQYEKIDLKAEVRNGLQRMRITEPRVRIVSKNISWESTRDDEFAASLARAFTPEELKGWMDEFTAAREQSPLFPDGNSLLAPHLDPQ